MARMASTLRHLGYLAPSYSRLDGPALARTLVDHVVAFAWISAKPNDRLPAFLRSSFKDQLAKDARRRERGEEPLIEDALRERVSAYTREVNVVAGQPRPLRSRSTQGRTARRASDARSRLGGSSGWSAPGSGGPPPGRSRRRWGRCGRRGLPGCATCGGP